MGAGLLDSIFCRHWLNGDILKSWQDSAIASAWLEVEQALAKVQAEIGLIPSAAATEISLLDAKNIDWPRLQVDIAHQLHPFTPILHQWEEQCSAFAAGYLHWGATTQNIFDTATALQLKRSNAIIDAELCEALQAIATLAQRHCATPMPGRTHGQHALPITFGLKLAGWHAEISRHQFRLRESSKTDLVALMGGAVGSFSAMQGQGRIVQTMLAQRLGLADGGIPMRSMGDRFAHHISLMALMGNTIEKIAREIVFLQRTEIAEVYESHHDGKMGSSTMAQKRNPSHALNLIGLAYRLRANSHLMHDAMVCENEGFAANGNLADVTISEAVVCAGSLASGLVQLVKGLRVDAVAMQRNLELTQGMIMSEALMMCLGREIGRNKAHQVLYEVTHAVLDQGHTLRQALITHPLLVDLIKHIDIDALTNPQNYLGESVSLTLDQIGALPKV